MVAQLTWPSAMYSGAPSYHTLSANNGLYLSKQANVPEMRLWVIQRGETVKGERVFRKESYSFFYCLVREALML